MPRPLFPAVCVLLVCLPLPAAEETGSGGPGDETHRDPTVREVVVIGERPDPTTELLIPDDVEWGNVVSVGTAILELPGVYAVRRGADATEPVIRGLGWERVATQIDFLPAYGACPARMDPPVTYLKPNAVNEVEVVRGLPSVTLGPGGTAGRVVVSTDYQRDPGAGPGVEGWFRLAGDTARSGLMGSGGFRGGNDRLDYSGSLEAVDFGDYESAGGVRVPATNKGWNGALTLGWRPDGKSRWRNGLLYVKEDRIDYPSLPMDSDNSDFWVYTTGYRRDLDAGSLERMDVSLGYQGLDHTMSNRDKPNRGVIRAQAETEASVVAGRLGLSWRLSPYSVLEAGIDGSGVARDGIRERYMVGPGKTFFDRIWPDATQRDLGLFAEATMAVAPRWTLRAGGRVDWVRSDAAAADDPSLMGRTVRENYVHFYGPDAAGVKGNDTLFSGNFVVEWEPADRTEVHLGVGLTSRAPGITERYFAFAPAPGGYQVGNPALDPEQKLEAEVGLEYRDENYSFYLSLFYDWFRDYVLQTAIDELDVNGDGVDDIVKGFVNVDARLYGLEAGGTIHAGGGWTFPVALAFVRGLNETDGGDLPEIPPLEVRGAARYTWDGATSWWCELGGRFVNRQDRVDPAFPEDPTPGFSVYHLRGMVQLSRIFTLQAGIENLLDRDYSEHLTREAMLPVGDLMPGQEVPAPGRGFHLSVRAVF